MTKPAPQLIVLGDAEAPSCADGVCALPDFGGDASQDGGRGASEPTPA